ncbi:MAG: TetR/AcrR family transcriptional regulator [Spirochaetales bacterium]|nr:TetR/AcrR family transcriptional regulator [Spirochaetales bacterium]
MKPTFENISEKKKQRVINACIDEFGEYGYAASSMDGIIKRAGISKGGLYEYVSSKRELFLFTVEYTYSKLYEYLYQRLKMEKEGLQADLLERLRHVAELAIDFYIEHPQFIYLIVRTSNLPDEKISSEIEEIFGHHFIALFGDTDTSRLKYPRKRVLDLAMWLLLKTRLDFLNEIKTEKTPDKIKADYMENWEFYLSILDGGIYSS